MVSGSSLHCGSPDRIDGLASVVLAAKDGSPVVRSQLLELLVGKFPLAELGRPFGAASSTSISNPDST